MANAGERQNAGVESAGLGVLPQVFRDRLSAQCDAVAVEVLDEEEFVAFYKDIADHMRDHIKEKHTDKTQHQKDAMMRQMRQMLWAAWSESRNVLRMRDTKTPEGYKDPREKWGQHKGSGPVTGTNGG